MKPKRLSKKELEARLVRTKIKDPEARKAALEKALSQVRTTARIDFVRSIRGRSG